VNETKENSLSISWDSPDVPEDFITEFHIYAELNKTFDTFVSEFQLCLVFKNYFLSPIRDPGSGKATGREHKSCLGWVFNFKFACFDYERNCTILTNTPTFKVENLAQVLSC
jgi:hypothetical protein